MDAAQRLNAELHPMLRVPPASRVSPLVPRCRHAGATFVAAKPAEEGLIVSS